MKRIIIAVLSIISTFIITAHAAPDQKASLDYPHYMRKKSLSCGCNCENKIIYKQAKVNYKNLVTWAKEATVATYSYGFGNYKAALEKASQYFTPQGWDEFANALRHSHNLEIVAAHRLLMKAIPAGEPTVVKAKTQSGQQAWRIELPIMVKYENSDTTVREPLKITMQVIQTEPHKGVQGLGITQFIAEPDKQA